MKNNAFKIKVLFSVLCFYFLIGATETNAQTTLEDGLRYIKKNEPDKAIAILYKETKNPNANPKVYLYLGVACIQSGKYLDAVTWLTTGKERDFTQKHLYSYNLGNAYFMQNLLEKAHTEYSEAIIQNANYASAFLNRANTEIKLEKFTAALQDYKTYLELKPNSPQRPAIEAIINLLEENEKQAELAKLAEEAKKIAEQKRKKEFLNNVNDSLNSIDNAESISAGSEGTIDYTEEGDLE
ncbi:MAG: hypothetical protein CR988_03965 [Treponema sp.]|nr:MAG: hypothetical protein CR988_03965 [Treponema sp.]